MTGVMKVKQMKDSSISIEDFIGNDAEISKVINFLNDSFHEKIEPDYAFVMASTGNGKTSLVNALGNSFHVKVHRISPYDVSSKDDVNHILEGLNTTTLSKAINQKATHKIILVDDIDLFNKRYQKMLLSKIPKFTSHPIIFTCTNVFRLPRRFWENHIICKLKKPSTKDLEPFLKKKVKDLEIIITHNKIHEIAKKSKSVRSAINSLYSASVNEDTSKDYSIKKKLYMVKNHTIDVPIDNFMLKQLNLNCYDASSIDVLTHLYAQSTHRYLADVHPFVINHQSIRLPSKLGYKKIQKQNQQELTEEQERLCKELHISKQTFLHHYQFLMKQPKKKKTSVVKKKKKPSMTSLSKFY